ncbi:aspartate/glutamate racemase family protein [Pelosinus sp. UFO1]|uniref:aspartate/glutamate racemase family protein n=1 Tax=Pelosinus sp. UFO1 TaxID=484770 RepID=UPI0004D11881|nr:amino acid racemase [Pelosinus sp. UFO1]AIF51308.1 aspartate racemase [Pelosinus sp. UFO1]
MITIGILGGMGPMATADLFEKIIKNTPASTDQEHLKVIVYNNPQIPSRINAIINGTESPLKELISSAKLLEKAGAEVLVMPCNTAHFWYQDIQKAVNVKLINMIENTADYVKVQKLDSTEKFMLFASVATVKTEMYQKAFLAKGLVVLTPNIEEQKIVSLAIQEAKAGRIEDNSNNKLLSEIIFKYQQMGVSAFIAGCTEIPLLFPCISGNYQLIDPTKILAQTVVNQAMKINLKSSPTDLYCNL